MNHTSNRETIRVGGKLKELITIHDSSGTVLHKALRPLMLDFTAHDAVQVIVGATLLAIPVGLTEEVWMLGETLSIARIVLIALLSIIFIGGFTYYVSYRRHIQTHKLEFVMISMPCGPGKRTETFVSAAFLTSSPCQAAVWQGRLHCTYILELFSAEVIRIWSELRTEV